MNKQNLINRNLRLTIKKKKKKFPIYCYQKTENKIVLLNNRRKKIY